MPTFLFLNTPLDETAMLYSAPNIEAAATDTKDDLIVNNEWMNSNVMNLNLKKTAYTIFNNNKNTEIKLSIGGEEIKQVEKIKYLGLLIDDKLK